jgi:hypothetical protein
MTIRKKHKCHLCEYENGYCTNEDDCIAGEYFYAKTEDHDVTSHKRIRPISEVRTAAYIRYKGNHLTKNDQRLDKFLIYLQFERDSWYD